MGKRITFQEKRRETVQAAMPEVKKLVRRFGRSAITSCLNKLREYEKNVHRMQQLKQEVARLERQLTPN
jgi:hypothetical protein